MFMYKKMALMFTFLIMLSLSGFAISQTREGVVERVDNTNGLIVINDEQYKLQLNTKVYNHLKQPLNRYALRVNQAVVFENFYDKKINYIKTIIILKKN